MKQRWLNMEQRKIVKFEYVKTHVPGGSCGTGYSEPDIFHVTCEDGFETNVWIDIWYLPEKYVKEWFEKGMREKFGEPSDYNFDEAFKMYLEALRPRNGRPYDFWMEK